MVFQKAEQEWREEFANTMYEPGSPQERALVKKIDMRIVPSIWVCHNLLLLLVN